MDQFSDQGGESFAIRTVDVGTVSAMEDKTKLLVQDTRGVKPTVLCTCKNNALKKTSLSIQLQIQLKSSMGESRYKCHGQKMDPQRRGITMLRTSECCPQRKPSRERSVSRTYKSKFRSCSNKSLS